MHIFFKPGSVLHQSTASSAGFTNISDFDTSNGVIGVAVDTTIDGSNTVTIFENGEFKFTANSNFNLNGNGFAGIGNAVIIKTTANNLLLVPTSLTMVTVR